MSEFSDLTPAEGRALLGPVTRLPRDIAYGLITKGYLRSVLVEGTAIDAQRFVYRRTLKGDAYLKAAAHVR